MTFYFIQQLKKNVKRRDAQNKFFLAVDGAEDESRSIAATRTAIAGTPIGSEYAP
jgi:hypothetical protein